MEAKQLVDHSKNTTDNGNTDVTHADAASVL